MSQTLYAFWENDRFPYVLGGEVLCVREGGMVTIRGYEGMLFPPIKLVPLEEGLEIHKQLRALEREYRLAQTELKTNFTERRNEIISWKK